MRAVVAGGLVRLELGSLATWWSVVYGRGRRGWPCRVAPARCVAVGPSICEVLGCRGCAWGRRNVIASGGLRAGGGVRWDGGCSLSGGGVLGLGGLTGSCGGCWQCSGLDCDVQDSGDSGLRLAGCARKLGEYHARRVVTAVHLCVNRRRREGCVGGGGVSRMRVVGVCGVVGGVVFCLFLFLFFVRGFVVVCFFCFSFVVLFFCFCVVFC